MINSEQISSNLSREELDIRKTGIARFMDQKVTPDVLSFIADCVMNLVSNDVHKQFTKDDVWESKYFSENVRAIYNKPATTNKAARHEYDKFCAQPLEALAYAGVLRKQKIGRKNVYSVNSPEILEFIALSELRGFDFLSIYVPAVLVASGFGAKLEVYKEKGRNRTVTQSDYADIKTEFRKLIRGNTPIKGDTEMNRIFPKVFNIIAATEGIQGSVAGRISKHPFYRTDLIYNRVNFRDKNKSKGEARSEIEMVAESKAYSDYEMSKVMNAVRERHKPSSEVRDSLATGQATEVHHIFAKSTHPQYRALPENLILVTSQQHHTKAHPNGHTNVSSPEYRITCLQAKMDSIRASDVAKDGFYSRSNFVQMINEIYGGSLAPDASFDSISAFLRSIR